MKPNSSSTSSSDEANLGPRADKTSAVHALLWAALFLVAIDVAASLSWPLPKNPHEQGTALARFLDYGRSVEGKLRYITGETDETSALITQAGWIVTDTPDKQPARTTLPDHYLVAAYGQSFTANVIEALAKFEPRFDVRVHAGPSGPLSQSYAFYQQEEDQIQADVVLIGVLASSLARLVSMSNMTVGFEGVMPSTYPRYLLEGEQLIKITPTIQSLSEMRQALKDNARWDAFLQQLRQYDLGYSPLVFDASWTDHSALLRLIRRGYGQKHSRDVSARYFGPSGFSNADRLLDVARAIFKDFADSAKARGQLPYVILFQDRGYGDSLERAFGPYLDEIGVAHLSSHRIAPATDARTFVPDGHFRPDLFEEIAHVVHRDLLARLPARPAPLPSAVQPEASR
ncbi:MAG TPA: hypothetical protein VHM70_02970 [Polyangiaceae bacterium]|jgi:hypothetical protein|nr:hypothetical protein [Polyangiaceae bacterium]